MFNSEQCVQGQIMSAENVSDLRPIALEFQTPIKAS
jgi:hypothetical protein